MWQVLGLACSKDCLVSGLFLLHSQGDSTRQRHGDGCRVPVSHHLFINLKSFTYNSISEDADVFFFLYDTREAKQIRYMKESQCTNNSPECGRCMQTNTCLHTVSVQQIDWGKMWLTDTLKLWTGFLCSEKFMVKLNKNGGPKNPEKVDRLCALFTVTYFPFEK